MPTAPPLPTADEPSPPLREDERNEEEVPFYIPSNMKLQFAGNVGLLSAGGGFSWLHRSLDLDLLLGWVPPMGGSASILSGTLKITVWPISLDLGTAFRVRPISFGAFSNLTFGERYFVFLPDRYPSDYYPASTALRFGGFVGGSVGARKGLPFGRWLDLYWEAGFTDVELYLVLVNPRSRSFFEAFHLALGLSLGF